MPTAKLRERREGRGLSVRGSAWAIGRQRIEIGKGMKCNECDSEVRRMRLGGVTNTLHEREVDRSEAR